MGDWNFLGGILEDVHIHSTTIGKIWLTILFIFRMLILGVAAEDVWNDEQSGFICNTEQPGCRNVCYDQAFPISLIRYWVLQVIFVSSPSLVYMGHALFQLRVLEKERQKMKTQLRRELEGVEFEEPGDRRRLEQELCQLEQRKLNKAPLRGPLLCTYVIHIFTRSAVEVGFMIGQYLLYGFHLEPLFKCQSHPCPNIIDCFISRPTEKTIFLLFMQSIATVSLFLNVLEIAHLGIKKIKRGFWGQYKLKDEHHDEFFANKSKQNSAKYKSTSANSPKQHPYAPDYNLLFEKKTHPTVCPSLNSSSALPVDAENHSGNNEKCVPDEQETLLSNELDTTNHLQHISSNDNEGTLKIFENEANDNQVRERREIYDKDGERDVSADLENHIEQSSPPVFCLPANCYWKPQGLSDTWGSSTEEDQNQSLYPKGNVKGQFGEGTIRTLLPSQGDSDPLDIPDTPDFFGEPSFASEFVKTCKSPSAGPPYHSVTLTTNLMGRRAPTDLQI
ncbi:PREDICTED: gap junction alpha-9 protein [Elephantulus edwardii]|uniref:gap junction alpha-9 protein n=1 Tax=Elephantulus edwardii TaxID=28737 RepID=UPI0003F08DD9|nr:PREDICTED: gap junction alpha-9 protein [Elephantulus edwardii]